MCEKQARDLGVLEESKVRVIQGHEEMTLPLQISPTLPMHCVWVHKSASQIDQLGNSIAPVEIQRLANA